MTSNDWHAVFQMSGFLCDIGSIYSAGLVLQVPMASVVDTFAPPSSQGSTLWRRGVVVFSCQVLVVACHHGNRSGSRVASGGWNPGQHLGSVEQEAVTIRRELAATFPESYLPDLAISLTNLGVSFSKLSRPDEALSPAQEAKRATDCRPTTAYERAPRSALPLTATAR